MKKKLISVIAACYNEEESLHEILNRTDKVFKNLQHYSFELIFVDNDSTDNSYKILEKLAKNNKQIKVIFMSRNFGSPQPSFIAGLEICRGEAAIFLHGDLQDPPELIPKFINKWEEGYDVVYGQRNKRKGYGTIMNLLYRGFYTLLRKLAYINIPLNAGEFSLINRQVIDELLKIKEYDYYLRGLRAYVGFKQIGINYIREARKHGKSTENFFTSLYWAKTIIINFSFKPLSWISGLAFFMVILSLISIVTFLIYYLINPNSPRGIPTLFILILFLGGVQLLSLSVIAEYISKIFLEVKGRPKYIIKKILNK